MGKGWIKLYRKSVDNPLYFAEPFDKWHAWQDLLLMASHERKSFISNGRRVTVEAGQLVTSVPILAKRWRWSENKVRRFLGSLNGSGMSRTDGSALGSAISIVNWAQYQDGGSALGSAVGSAVGSADGSLTRSKEVKKKEGHQQERHQYTEEELFAGLD